MSKKVLGKIDEVSFGLGGYQNAMFGLSLTLSGDGGSVGDFKGTWGLGIDCSENAEWTEEDRSNHFADTMRFTNQLLIDAKKEEVSNLVGTPVEIEFEGMRLKSWRVLTEVL